MLRNHWHLNIEHRVLAAAAVAVAAAAVAVAVAVAAVTYTVCSSTVQHTR